MTSTKKPLMQYIALHCTGFPFIKPRPVCVGDILGLLLCAPFSHVAMCPARMALRFFQIKFTVKSRPHWSQWVCFLQASETWTDCLHQDFLVDRHAGSPTLKLFKLFLSEFICIHFFYSSFDLCMLEKQGFVLLFSVPRHIKHVWIWCFALGIGSSFAEGWDWKFWGCAVLHPWGDEKCVTHTTTALQGASCVHSWFSLDLAPRQAEYCVKILQ